MHRLRRLLPVGPVLAGISVQAAPSGASLVQRACCDICPPVHEKYEAEFNPLHMNWVLVDDSKGNHRAQMRWVVDR
jgi:hypothetical protein